MRGTLQVSQPVQLKREVGLGGREGREGVRDGGESKEGKGEGRGRGS
jgi:hypothetical protein